MDQIDGNWRYRWFVGLKLDEAVWDVTVFTKNRERLLQGEVSQRFFERVVEQARAAQLLDDEHFTVDGSLIEAWASRYSFEKNSCPSQNLLEMEFFRSLLVLGSPEGRVRHPDN